MTPRAKRPAEQDALYELEQLQNELEIHWFDKSLPDDWNGMDFYHPVDRHTTRVTLRMDSDMLRWFRKLGPGYQKRINRILRVYWTTLLAGHIKAYPNDDTTPRLKIEARRIQDELRAGRGALE